MNKKELKMHCIVCKKEIISIIHHKDEEINPDYVEPAGLDKYVNCTNWNDGTVDFIYPGYGSCHDTDKIRIAICDECLTDRLADGTVQICGNYLSPESNNYYYRWAERKKARLILEKRLIESDNVNDIRSILKDALELLNKN